ncbi:MAG: hypothetical protein J5818_06820, partial [Eggerthellaceae bacterium]|nr:hypothetical protein [Eggerthellaceae bacterium]
MAEAVIESVTVKPLAGVRLCQAFFGFEMALALVFGFLCSPHLFDYDISMVRVLLLMAGGAVTIWLISQHARSARVVGAVTALSCAALAMVDHAAFDALDTLAGYVGQPATTAFMIAEYAGAIAVAAYLVFSPQAKRVLCSPLDLAPSASEGHSWDKPMRERVRTRSFWRDLLVYFIVFSMLGHWAEMLFCQLIVSGVFMGDYDPSNAMLWSQWLFPFTAEGAAVVAIVVLLHPASRWLLKKTGNRVWLAVLLSFLLNALVCTCIDFTTGMIANQDYSLWDYRALPFNFMGQVCLQNSMVYSIAATLIVWVFYPLMDRLLRRAPRGVVNAASFGLIGMYLFLAMLYFFDVASLFGG